jgi:hypothetical protein
LKKKLSFAKINLNLFAVKTFTVSPVYVPFHDILLYWILLIIGGHGTLGTINSTSK